MPSSSWCAGRPTRAIGWCMCSRRCASHASFILPEQRGYPGAVVRTLAWLAAALLVAATHAAAGTAAAAPAAATQAAAVPPLPVIIDTDVGDDIDDAFALAVALQDPRLEVIGVTTAWGDTRTRTLLVRRLLAALGRHDVVVAQGPATANPVPFTQKKWALGATDTSAAPDAIEFLRDQAHQHPGQVTLIALAPLSNIEALAQRDPTALKAFRQVA